MGEKERMGEEERMGDSGLEIREWEKKDTGTARVRDWRMRASEQRQQDSLVLTPLASSNRGVGFSHWAGPRQIALRPVI
ncbi:hypothetical protein SESBI_40967 [Sesbania bispinosa]|nr:hypothetical protein SESBI_40967 [Sesbania bispinosa]